MAPVTLATLAIRCQACGPLSLLPSPSLLLVWLTVARFAIITSPALGRWEEGPYWEENTVLLCAVTKYRLDNEGADQGGPPPGHWSWKLNGLHFLWALPGYQGLSHFHKLLFGGLAPFVV